MIQQRVKNPDKRTPQGQFMLYVTHLMSTKGVSADDIAKATGKHRGTIFRWLRGEGSPSGDDMTRLAKCLGLKSWRHLVPPRSFIEQL